MSQGTRVPKLGTAKRPRGESLLNDGTAIVLFALMMKLVNGEELAAPDVTFFALRSAVRESAASLP